VNRRLALPVAALAALAAVVALSGCTADGTGISDQYSQAKNSSTGYISGDGSVVTITADKREKAPTWSSKTIDGDAVSNDSYAGKVVVINFWYASCPPCRSEAPDLAKLHTQLSPKGVEFLGVDTRDTEPIARGFLSKYKLGYSTVLDDADNEMQLAFAGDVPPKAVPTTLVLDKKGRVAARFSGEIESPSVVTSVVEDLEAEH
jgi:peroxiredoxin